MNASARCAISKTAASSCSPGAPATRIFTTDTTAILRAAEMSCDAVFKATDVDGVYTADPKRDPKATRYERLDHQEALDRNLKIMDATAFALARENRMPIIVFSIKRDRRDRDCCARKGSFYDCRLRICFNERKRPSDSRRAPWQRRHST